LKALQWLQHKHFHVVLTVEADITVVFPDEGSRHSPGETKNVESRNFLLSSFRFQTTSVLAMTERTENLVRHFVELHCAR